MYKACFEKEQSHRVADCHGVVSFCPDCLDLESTMGVDGLADSMAKATISAQTYECSPNLDVNKPLWCGKYKARCVKREIRPPRVTLIGWLGDPFVCLQSIARWPVSRDPWLSLRKSG
eukprot:1129282-Prorocentrum_minimum.AAC.3